MLNNKTYTVFFILMTVTITAQAQCAMCRAVLETEEGSGMAEGINDGIIYLMVIPYLLIAGIGIIIYKKFFQTKKN